MIIVDDARRKGGAPQLGASRAGERGPFGVRPDPEDPDDTEPAPDTAGGEPR